MLTRAPVLYAGLKRTIELPTPKAAFEHVMAPNRRYFFPGNSSTAEKAENECGDFMMEHLEGLRNIEIVQLLGGRGSQKLATPIFRAKNIRLILPFVGAAQRNLVNAGLADFVPMFLRPAMQALYDGELRPDVAFLQTTPPDQNGFRCLGICGGLDRTALHGAKVVVAFENPHMPWVKGNDMIISPEMVDYVVPVDWPLRDMTQLPEGGEMTQVMQRIAKHIVYYIMSRLPKGAKPTFQGGIGSGPNFVLTGIADEGIPVNIWAELGSDSLWDLYRKKLLGACHIGFFIGSPAGCEMFHDPANREAMEFHDQRVINDWGNIANINFMNSLCSVMAVDGHGQAYAHYINDQVVSGFGGQVEFDLGATRSNGGNFWQMVASRNVRKNKKTGETRTDYNIIFDMENRPYLTPVTTSAAEADKVVTEWGIACLKGADTHLRARLLCEISHPDVREENIRKAERKLIKRIIRPEEVRERLIIAPNA